MAFRRFRKRSFARRPFVRRKSPYEMCQLSVCREGLETGLSSCGVPDQFFTPLITGRDWMRSQVSGTGLPNDTNVIPAHAGEGIIVKGIEFDFYHSYVPDEGTSEQLAQGITSIRCALIIMRLSAPGSAGELERPQPDTPAAAILFNNDGLLRQPEATSASDPFRNFEYSKKYRIVWRGMYMQPSVIVAAGTNTIASFMVPGFANRFRHVKCRRTVRLGMNEGLFFLTEVVNPFLEINPTLALDLLGKCGVRPASKGNRFDT